MGEKLTIILDDEDLQFAYPKTDLIQFRKLWNEYRKCSKNTLAIINQIAEDFATSPDNIALLAIDQIRKGEIT